MKLPAAIKFTGVVFITLVLADWLAGALIIHQSKRTHELDDRSNLSVYDTLPWAKAYWQEQGHLRAQYHSHIGWKYDGYEGHHINIDNSGLRVVPDSKKNRLTNRITILGGSTIWGTGVSDQHTIPNELALLCDTCLINNLGQPGYTAYQSYLLLLSQHQQGLEQDWLITYDGVNNTWMNRRPWTHRRENQIRHQFEGLERRYTEYSGIFPNFRKWWANHSSGKKPKTAPRFAAAENEQMARELLDTWMLMKNWCQTKSVNFICALQPLAFVGSPDLTHIDSTAISWQNAANWKNGFEYYEHVKQLIQQPEYANLEPHFVDLSHLMDNVPTTYIDFCHLSPNGNRKVAQELWSKIEMNHATPDQETFDSP